MSQEHPLVLFYYNYPGVGSICIIGAEGFSCLVYLRKYTDAIDTNPLLRIMFILAILIFHFKQVNTELTIVYKRCTAIFILMQVSWERWYWYNKQEDDSQKLMTNIHLK